MGSFQTSPRFDLRPSSGTQTKAVDPVSRFRWALSFQGISHAAGKVLAALADHADQRKLTCFPSVETLARETQVSERGVRYALRKLEAAGAILTERSRGRSSSLYRLMIPLNPADLAPSYPARIAPPNPARIAPLTELSLEQSNKEKREQQQSVRVREAQDNLTAAAAAAPIDSSSPTAKSKTGRHTCPKCERTWPKQFGAVCYNCQCDVERARHDEEELAKLEEDSRLYEEAHRVSETAQTLNSAVPGKLPGSWLYHQDLLPLIGDRDFNEVCDIVKNIGVRTLPEPEKGFRQ